MKETAMGAQARKEPADAERYKELSQEARRELLVHEADSDPMNMWRGLLLAVLLATPFWIALYLLLRWWTS